MTGIPTQITIADIVFGRSGAIAEADRAFFNLGAVSLAMTDLLPSRPETASNASVFEVWRPIIRAVADSPAGPGIWTNLKTVRDVLGRARKIVEDAKSNFITSLEAKAELLAMADEIADLGNISNRLRTQVAALSGLRSSSLSAINALRPVHKSPPVRNWTARTLFHGRRTGAFYEALRRRARATNDPQLIAFAAGLGVSYGGALAGNAFRNGAVGAPIRNHFWRSRSISHRIDTWVWGYYRTQADFRASGGDITFSPALSNRVPSPRIGTWADVCSADLQKRFEFGGITPEAVLNGVATSAAIPPFLPTKLVDLWINSMNEAHPDGVAPANDAAGVQSAYALTWLTTWMQTSPDFLRAIPPDQINWPDSCGPRPSWAAPDGSILVGGNTIQPPQPAIGDPTVAKIASAIAAALLALVNFLVGNVAGGIEALAAGLALLDAGTPPNWGGMGCDLGWTDCFIISLENALRALLVAAGLAPPYGIELEHNELLFQATQALTPNAPAIVPPDAALLTCLSPSRLEGQTYPHGPWQPSPTSGSNWLTYPTEPEETPGTDSWPGGGQWPNAFVDGMSVTTNATPPPAFNVGQVTPLELTAQTGKPTVLDADEWDLRMQRARDGGNPGGRPFGNAVDLSLAIIDAPPDTLRDWDLDGDRGIGWPTWVWPDATATSGRVERG